MAERTLESLRPVAEATGATVAVVYRSAGSPHPAPTTPAKFEPVVVEGLLTRGEVTTLDTHQSTSIGALVDACTTPGLPGSWLGRTVQHGSVLVAATEGKLTSQARVAVTESGSRRRYDRRFTTTEAQTLQKWFAGPLADVRGPAVLG